MPTATSQRNSNIEALRMLAMLMVLVLHSNFLISYPDENLDSTSSLIKIAVQMVNICAVDVFVFISGWFKIKPSLSGLLAFLWQVFYFVAILLFIQCFFNDGNISPKDFLMLFGLLGGGGWFVGSYIALYILSPILNSFVEAASTKRLCIVTLSFFVFQTLWGLTLSVDFITMGYSAFSFIGIYLLAQTLRRITISYDRRVWVIIFIFCSIVDFLIYYISSKMGLIYIRDMVVAYINPLVIIQAVALFYIVVLNHDSKNKYINYFAKSCFGVYLFHVGTPFALDTFKNVMTDVYANYNGIIYFAHVLYVIVLVYITAIIMDLPRRYLWDKVFSKSLASTNKYVL